MRVRCTSNKIYSHSYLGLGLMAAREAIFSLNQERLSLESACMVTSGATMWSFHGKDYSILPSADQQGRLRELHEDCGEDDRQ